MSIVEITNYTDHQNFIKDNERAVIFFGSKNCGHCTHIAPIFKTIAIEYPEIKFGHVEVTKVKTKNIDGVGVPQFVGYVRTVPVEVIVGASPDDIVAMLEQKILPY